MILINQTEERLREALDAALTLAAELSPDTPFIDFATGADVRHMAYPAAVEPKLSDDQKRIMANLNVTQPADIISGIFGLPISGRVPQRNTSNQQSYLAAKGRQAAMEAFPWALREQLLAVILAVWLLAPDLPFAQVIESLTGLAHTSVHGLTNEQLIGVCTDALRTQSVPRP